MRSLAVLLALLVLAPIAPAAAAPELVWHRLEPGETLTLAFPPRRAGVMIAEPASPVRVDVALDSELDRTWNKFYGHMFLWGRDAASLRWDYAVWKRGDVPFAYAYVNTPAGRVVLPEPDPDFWMGGWDWKESASVTFGPEADRVFVGAMNTLGGQWTFWNVTADAPVDLGVADAAIAHYDAPNWPSAAHAYAPMASPTFGAALDARVDLAIDGRLYGVFRNDPGAGVARESLSGPGFFDEGRRSYNVRGGAGGAWTFDAPLTAGGHHAWSFAYAVDVPEV